MAKRYKYNTFCKECLKEGIEEFTYVGHWTYETADGGVKVTSHCHCDRGHRWTELSETIHKDLPVLPSKLYEDIFINKENVMKAF